MALLATAGIRERVIASNPSADETPATDVENNIRRSQQDEMQPVGFGVHVHLYLVTLKMRLRALYYNAVVFIIRHVETAFVSLAKFNAQQAWYVPYVCIGLACLCATGVLLACLRAHFAGTAWLENLTEDTWWNRDKQYALLHDLVTITDRSTVYSPKGFRSSNVASLHVNFPRVFRDQSSTEAATLLQLEQSLRQNLQHLNADVDVKTRRHVECITTLLLNSSVFGVAFYNDSAHVRVAWEPKVRPVGIMTPWISMKQRDILMPYAAPQLVRAPQQVSITYVHTGVLRRNKHAVKHGQLLRVQENATDDMHVIDKAHVTTEVLTTSPENMLGAAHCVHNEVMRAGAD